MGKVILCNTSDTVEVLSQLRQEWVYDILESLGIPSEIRNVTSIFDIRAVLVEAGINVELKSGGEEVDVYKQEWYGDSDNGGWLPTNKKHLVAQWKKPRYIRRVEGKEVYYELHLDEWSMTKRRA